MIFASARKTEDDRINSFDIGVMTSWKTLFHEGVSRVNALMRRAYGSDEEKERMSFGDVTIDLSNRNVVKGGRQIALAKGNSTCLRISAGIRTQRVPKDKLIAEVWGAFSEVEPSTLTVHIRWLREKLEDDPAQPRYIKTVWRLGYMLEDEQ